MFQMNIRDFAVGKALNTREGFDFLFSYGVRLCDEFYIPSSTLPVSYVLEDLEDAVSNPCSSLPIPKVRDLARLPR